MSVAGDRSAGALPARPWRCENPLIALWLLLPACVWWIDFGSAFVPSGSSRWTRGPILVALGLWSIWAIGEALRAPRGFRSPPAPAGGTRPPPPGVGTILYLLAGAGFLVLLGPGIAPIHDSTARGLVGALMITCAWAGWAALHPGARRLAMRMLVRLFRRA